MKKVLSFFLAIVMVITVFNGVTMNVSASGLGLQELKNKFPNKSYWNHTTTAGHGYSGTWATGPCNNPDGVTWSPCYSHSANAPVGYSDCNSFEGAMQCCGFARKLAYDAYGEYCYNWGTTNSLDNVKPGDVIHYYGWNADWNNGHWVFVTGVSGSTLSVGQCNIIENCQIRWDLTIDKSNIAGNATVYIAPYQLKETTHTHSYTISGYESAHPHKKYLKCSCGAISYTGENHRYLSSCSTCNPPTSGSCGSGVRWYYVGGILIISGTGEMKNYTTFVDVPWISIALSIRGIVVEEGVTGIGDYAFDFLPSLCYIEIPNSVTSIGAHAFGRCKSLADVYYEGTEKQWNKITIGSGNESLINANIRFQIIASGECGDNVTWKLDNNGLLTIRGTGKMDDYPYYPLHAPWYDYRDYVKSIVIEDGVTSIATLAFDKCRYLTSITIPASVANIGLSAFFWCNSLETITVAKGNTTFHSNGNCIIETNTNMLVSGCKTSIIPDYVTSIRSTAFYGCTTLTEVIIPDGVTSIGYMAFMECRSLTKITIPDSVTSIGDHAFYVCPKLNDVYYSGSEKQWNVITIGIDNESLTNSTIHFAKNTYTVSGTVKTFGDTTKAVTIELLSGETVVDTKTVTGNSGTYAFEEVEEGTYTLRVSKTKHAIREYEVTVADADVTQDTAIWLYGDVTGDGIINATDVLQMNRKVANLSSAFNVPENSDYRFKVANITAVTGTDTLLNSVDILQINRKIANLSSIFDKMA